MEQNIALLIADLSGYTALTETHGSSLAADLIDTFLEMVNECLVGDSHCHQCIGDEVLIVSSSADNLIATSVILHQKASSQDNFLQLHGGLHFGKILKRNNNYFGTGINLTSRIAAKANPGTFWCSDQFVNALLNKSEFEFRSKGKYSFKNLSEEQEVFELLIENKKPFFLDPVCRMIVSNEKTAVTHPEAGDIFFCSEHCRDIFIGNKVV
ncbi:MAG: adenylate/guanylate cyclase domain-containing protein [Bacteroidota bacterium]